MTEIQVNNLRQAVSVLLDHLEESTGGTLTLDAEYFWSIAKDELYDPYETPHTLTTGQLSESWENLQNIGNSPEMAINYALVWLSDVVKAVGYQVVG